MSKIDPREFFKEPDFEVVDRTEDLGPTDFPLVEQVEVIHGERRILFLLHAEAGWLAVGSQLSPEPEDEAEYEAWDGPWWEEVVVPVERPKTKADFKALTRWLRCEELSEATNG